MSQVIEEGFQRRRDPNFLLSSDPCLTAVGAPVALARNLAAYGSMGRRRLGRWSAWDKTETPFKIASNFLRDRHDICVPVELLTELIEEDRKLSISRRCVDRPDTLCSDLSWPGSCLENLSAAVDTNGCYPSGTAPLLLRTTGSRNDRLAFLRPQYPATKDGSTGEDILNTTIKVRHSLDLQCGPIRQISTMAPRANASCKVFARSDYNAILVKVRGSLDDLSQSQGSVFRTKSDFFSVKFRRAQAAEAAVSGGSMTKNEEMEGEGVFALFEEEKLVFSKRLTCAACSPYTPTHAAFLDEEYRLFHWHANRGAVMHGPGPLPFDPPPPSSLGVDDRVFPTCSTESNVVLARRSRSLDVALDYGIHPRVLWVAAQHRAYRVDLRERPYPANLAPALDPTVYFKYARRGYNVLEKGGCFGGRGDVPRVRALAVGRRSAHEIFVTTGLFLACMDARFPRDAVARWDLPEEVDQLRWLPGLPGEGLDAQEIVLASGRNSPRYYVNTWASDVPGWRGGQIRLGLDETSPAGSAAKRPLTFSLPATPLGIGETRSGALIVTMPPTNDESSGERAKGDDLLFVYATSVGDVYGQRFELGRMGGDDDRGENNAVPVPASHRCPLFAERIQSMLPCGDVCLDSKIVKEPVSAEDVATGNDNESVNGERKASVEEASSQPGERVEGKAGAEHPANESGKQAPALKHGSVVTRDVDRFPVNASALRSSVERVPEGELCTHSLLAPLTEAVAPVWGESLATGEKRVERKGSLATSLDHVRKRRERNLDHLQAFKENLASFLLAPRTPLELLAFCRQHLGLEFPEDPVTSDDAGKDAQDATKGANLGDEKGGDVCTKPRVDDSAIATDLASMVISWGPPFRSIDSTWKTTIAPSGYSVVSDFGRPPPRVPLVLLCSDHGVLKGKPSPLLGPGMSGKSYSVDVTMGDVKWLRDRWNSTT